MQRIPARCIASTVVAAALLLMTMAAVMPVAQGRAQHLPLAQPFNCPTCPPPYADGSLIAFGPTATAIRTPITNRALS